MTSHYRKEQDFCELIKQLKNIYNILVFTADSVKGEQASREGFVLQFSEAALGSAGRRSSVGRASLLRLTTESTQTQTELQR